MLALEILNQLMEKILITIAMITILATMRHIAIANSARFILAKYLASYIGAFALLAGIVLGYSTSPYQIELDFSNPQGMINISYDPALAIPSNAIPSNAIPSNQVQFAIPSNAIPSNAIPSNAIPSNAIPSNFTVVDAGTLENALPASAIPSNALPASAIPSNLLPPTINVPFKTQRLPDFGEITCKKRCTEDTKYSYLSDRVGIEVAGSTGPIEVNIWADTYNLGKGECTDLYWSVINADEIWFNGNATDPKGDTQVCPEESRSYTVDAANKGGYRGGSLIYIDVHEPVAQQPAVQQPSTGVEQPTSVDRCSLFENMDMKVTYLDWASGTPLQFHFKMPGGVPGLGKKISGDSEPWKYSAEIGSYTSSSCDIIQGYEDRLYCTISLPTRFSNAMSPMTLNVNGCDSPIYSNQNAFLPEMVDSGGESSTMGEEAAGGSSGEETSGGSGGETSSGGSSGGLSCGAEPSNLDHSTYQTWCACMGGSYSGPYSEKYWSNCNF